MSSDFMCTGVPGGSSNEYQKDERLKNSQEAGVEVERRLRVASHATLL